jgi:hypothetical protein
MWDAITYHAERYQERQRIEYNAHDIHECRLAHSRAILQVEVQARNYLQFVTEEFQLYDV